MSQFSLRRRRRQTRATASVNTWSAQRLPSIIVERRQQPQQELIQRHRHLASNQTDRYTLRRTASAADKVRLHLWFSRRMKSRTWWWFYFITLVNSAISRHCVLTYLSLCLSGGVSVTGLWMYRTYQREFIFLKKLSGAFRIWKFRQARYRSRSLLSATLPLCYDRLLSSQCRLSVCLSVWDEVYCG